jgi:hypothetical protein
MELIGENPSARDQHCTWGDIVKQRYEQIYAVDRTGFRPESCQRKPQGKSHASSHLLCPFRQKRGCCPEQRQAIQLSIRMIDLD